MLNFYGVFRLAVDGKDAFEYGGDDRKTFKVPVFPVNNPWNYNYNTLTQLYFHSKNPLRHLKKGSIVAATGILAPHEYVTKEGYKVTAYRLYVNRWVTIYRKKNDETEERAQEAEGELPPETGDASNAPQRRGGKKV